MFMSLLNTILMHSGSNSLLRTSYDPACTSRMCHIDNPNNLPKLINSLKCIHQCLRSSEPRRKLKDEHAHPSAKQLGYSVNINPNIAKPINNISSKQHQVLIQNPSQKPSQMNAHLVM